MSPDVAFGFVIVACFIGGCAVCAIGGLILCDDDSISRTILGFAVLVLGLLLFIGSLLGANRMHDFATHKVVYRLADQPDGSRAWVSVRLDEKPATAKE